MAQPGKGGKFAATAAATDMLEVVTLSESLEAEVRGVGLPQPLVPAIVAAIKAA